MANQNASSHYLQPGSIRPDSYSQLYTVSQVGTGLAQTEEEPGAGWSGITSWQSRSLNLDPILSLKPTLLVLISEYMAKSTDMPPYT